MAPTVTGRGKWWARQESNLRPSRYERPALPLSYKPRASLPHPPPRRNRAGGEFVVGVAGFEPATPCSRSRCATRLRYTPMVMPGGRERAASGMEGRRPGGPRSVPHGTRRRAFDGRSGRTRTDDPLSPRQVRYRAALHSVDPVPPGRLPSMHVPGGRPGDRWCERRESNPHEVNHMDLNHARLPVPPRSRRGRGGRIRTCDPLVPNQMRYQAALRPGPWTSGLPDGSNVGLPVASTAPCAGGVERVKGIEPSYSAWEAAALPLSYTRVPEPHYNRDRPFGKPRFSLAHRPGKLEVTTGLEPVWVDLQSTG